VTSLLQLIRHQLTTVLCLVILAAPLRLAKYLLLFCRQAIYLSIVYRKVEKYSNRLKVPSLEQANIPMIPHSCLTNL